MSKGVQIKVTAINENGGITGIAFNEIFDADLNITTIMHGEDFLPSDFEGDGYEITLTPIGLGDSANIIFKYGMVYDRIEVDSGPKQHTPLNGTRLSSTNSGQQYLRETKETTIELPPNPDAKYPGQYEFFYYFHNDISHTNSVDKGGHPGYLQFIDITIT